MATPKAMVSQRVYGAGALFALPEGTLTGAGTTAPYEPVPVDGKFVIGTGAGQVPGSALAVPLGVTVDGMTFTSGIDTEDDEAAEYYEPINTLVTGRTMTLGVELKQVNLTNLRLALNASTAQVEGTPDDTTGAFRLTPPNPGNEKRTQLLWISQQNDLMVVVFRALQTNEVSFNPNKGADGISLGLEFTAQLPDADIATTAYEIWGTGAKFDETEPGIGLVIP